MRRDVQHAVVDERLGFLRPVVVVAVVPDGDEPLDRLLVDLGQRAEALQVVAHAVVEDVLGVGGAALQFGRGLRLGNRCRQHGQHTGDQGSSHLGCPSDWARPLRPVRRNSKAARSSRYSREWLPQRSVFTGERVKSASTTEDPASDRQSPRRLILVPRNKFAVAWGWGGPPPRPARRTRIGSATGTFGYNSPPAGAGRAR